MTKTFQHHQYIYKRLKLQENPVGLTDLRCLSGDWYTNMPK